MKILPVNLLGEKKRKTKLSANACSQNYIYTNDWVEICVHKCRGKVGYRLISRTKCIEEHMSEM